MIFIEYRVMMLQQNYYSLYDLILNVCFYQQVTYTLVNYYKQNAVQSALFKLSWTYQICSNYEIF